MSSAAARKLMQQHPLQRWASPSRDASAVLHVGSSDKRRDWLITLTRVQAVSLASFAYSFSYLVRNPTPVNYAYCWHMQYLTIDGLSLATATFAVGLLADITVNHILFQIKNTLSVASAPMACLITLLYWGLRAVDPKLVLPDSAPPMPFLTDLSFHVIPSLTLVIDLLFFSPPNTIGFLLALALSVFIAFGYWFWIERCYQFNQFYPYPIFEMLNMSQRIGLFGFSAFLMAVATMLLAFLYRVVNGKEAREVKDLANGDRTKEKRSGNVKAG